MNCEEVLIIMQKYVDQEHTHAEYAEMSDHLHRCPSCTAIFERLKRLSDELEQLPKVVPAYSIVDTILPKLERMNLLYQPTWKERLMERFPYKTLGSLAAGIILVLVLLNSNLPGSLNSADNILMGAESANSEKAKKAASDQNTAENNLTSENETELKSEIKVEFTEPVVESTSTPVPEAEMPTEDTMDAESIDSEAITPAPAEDTGEKAKSLKATIPPATKKLPSPNPAATSTPKPQSPQVGIFSDGTGEEGSAAKVEEAEVAPSQSPSAVLTTDAEQFPSADGSYIAYVQRNDTSQQLVIVNQQSEPVFTSYAKEVEQILNIVWSEEVVSFDTVAGQVRRHYSVDLVKMQESEHVQ